MIYTIYTTATGRISRTISTDANIDLQLDVGEDYIAGSYSGGLNYIDSDKNVVEIPSKPSPHHVFDYETKQWVLSQPALALDVAMKRQKLLAASDWTQLPDVTLANKAAWATYRQELRDITTQAGYPTEITWPTPPQ